jgi:hypothetical protein
MKLPRAIRLDPSDTFVFERAAEPGEWAVSGAFLFGETPTEALGPKERHAFRSGFLGVRSLGFSTLVTVSEASESEREEAVQALTSGFLSLGAPDAGEARRAAEEEIAFAASLCDHPEGTLIAVERRRDDGGELRERFRTLRPRETVPGADQMHSISRAFTFHEVDGEEEGPEERVDLVSMLDTQHPQGKKNT